MRELKQELEKMKHLRDVLLSSDNQLMFVTGRRGIDIKTFRNKVKRLGLVVSVDLDPKIKTRFDWIVHEEKIERTPEGYPKVFVRVQNAYDFKRLSTNPQFVIVKHKNAIITKEQREKMIKLFKAIAK